MSYIIYRPFKVAEKTDGRPAVEVDVSGKRQQFVRSVSPSQSQQVLMIYQSAEELSSMVLTKMRETAEQYLNKKIKYVSLSMPFGN